MLLIVDDDIAIRTSLILLLKKEGFEVKGVGSPEETFDVLRTVTPELILLDLNFSIETSGKEGMQLLQLEEGYFPPPAFSFSRTSSRVKLAVAQSSSAQIFIGNETPT